MVEHACAAINTVSTLISQSMYLIKLSILAADSTILTDPVGSAAGGSRPAPYHQIFKKRGYCLFWLAFLWRYFYINFNYKWLGSG